MRFQNEINVFHHLEGLCVSFCGTGYGGETFEFFLDPKKHIFGERHSTWHSNITNLQVIWNQLYKDSI